jgi:hypothetical protein
MVNNGWALLRGVWLILTTDTDPTSNSKEHKESWASWDSKNEHVQLFGFLHNPVNG